jgi:hypothetical protein
MPLGIAAFTAASALAVGGLPASADPGTDGKNGLTEQRWRLPDHYTRAAVRALTDHEVVVSGLDNPRQLVWNNRGGLRIAEAGHGSYKPENCVPGGPEGGEVCIGLTGKISRVVYPATATNRKPQRIARGFLSAAGPDGTFAVGSDGVDQGPRGRTFVQETYAPPDIIPEGIGGRQAGKLMDLGKDIVANISTFELRHNPDGENVDSNPYAVLALKGRQLVADAGGDSIIQVRKGKKSLWTLLPGDTKDIDPVPTSLVRGPDGQIYVGTLYSGAPNKARVLKYDRDGNRLRSWHRFTTVTGVAVGKRGALYVSELFAGCPPNDQTCIPGRVTKVAPDGTRTRVEVPFPAGIVVAKQRLYVNAWSIAPAKGAFGNPEFSGQVWRFVM